MNTAYKRYSSQVTAALSVQNVTHGSLTAALSDASEKTKLVYPFRVCYNCI